MKSILISLYKTLIIKIKFSIILRKENIINKELCVVFDIDNTLANTWPMLIKEEKLDYRKLEYFSDVLEEVRNHESNQKCLLLFASVRPLSAFTATYDWLRFLNIRLSEHQIFLVGSPELKLYLLRLLKKKIGSVILYDDMSYGHEKGEVRFFLNVIKGLKIYDIQHVGFDELKLLQTNSIRINEKID